MIKKITLISVILILSITTVSAVSWNKVAEWDRENDGDTLNDFTSLMTEQSNTYKSDSGGWETKSNYLQFEEVASGNDGAIDKMKYSLQLPQNSGNIKLRLHFRGDSYEHSGMAFYANGTDGNQHNLACEPDNDLNIDYSCSSTDQSGDFTYDTTYTYNFGTELTHFKIASIVDDCCDDGGDWGEIRHFTVWVGEQGPNKPPTYRSPGDGVQVSNSDVDLSIAATDPQNEDITYKFYDASDNDLIDQETASSGATASITWQNLNDDQSYSWYVEACDTSGACTTYATWNFIVETGVTATNKSERDEDYQPQGADIQLLVDPPYYEGKINKLEDFSNQLEPGMDTTTFQMADPSKSVTQLSGQKNVSSNSDAKWHDSDGSQSSADQYAITKYLNWSISNRGRAFPPGKTYYHKDYDKSARFTHSNPRQRDDIKTVKVFGNSIAVVANKDFAGQSGTTVSKGDGIWIDPDDMRNMSRKGQIKEDWRAIYNYNIDLTGFDSGLGLNTGDEQGINFHHPDFWIMYGNVYFEGEKDNKETIDTVDPDSNIDEGYNKSLYKTETSKLLEPPVCGDDQLEYLMEEVGEVSKGNRFDGKYACSDSRRVCVDMSAQGSKIFNLGKIRQVDEPDETFGRLKNDKEVCALLPDSKTASRNYGDIFPMWYDQDYTRSLCKGKNTVFGSAAIRWIKPGQIKSYPHAFTGGIDDDWNARLKQLNDRITGFDNYTSKPGKSNYNNLNQISPVPTGAINQSVSNTNKSIITQGFCVGDDESEYLITQECNTNDLCKTDTSVIAVANSPDKCVLKNYSNSDNTKRDIFKPGEEVEFNLGSTTKEISCFNGKWFQDWPVLFQRENVNVPKGQTKFINFDIINPETTPTTYTIDLSTSMNDAWTKFSNGKDKFNTTINPSQVKTFNVKIFGGSTSIDSANIEVIANSKDNDISGSDSVTVDVTKQGVKNTKTKASKEAPGIGLIHIITLLIIASITYLEKLF